VECRRWPGWCAGFFPGSLFLPFGDDVVVRAHVEQTLEQSGNV